MCCFIKHFRLHNIACGDSIEVNVFLQHYRFIVGFTSCILRKTEKKSGSLNIEIPIISEKESRAMNPDYFLVLPWHFKVGILEREKEYLAKGGKFIFPLPEIEIV